MKRDFIAEQKLAVRNVVMNGLTVLSSLVGMKAYAEEGDGGAEGGNSTEEPSGSAPTLNYEDLIAKARKDEKDKQYKTIEKLKADLKTMTKSNNDNLIKVGELEGTVDELNKKLTSSNTGDSEAVKTLKDELAKVKGELETAKTDLETAKSKAVDEAELRKTIEEEVKSEYEVKNYRLELLSKNADVLVPELVMGTTKEELDNSLTQAKARSEEIRKKFDTSVENAQNGNNSAFASRMPAISSPSASTAGGTVSLEDLARLNPASPEYAEMRKKLGLR